MPNLSKITKDHDVIRAWAEERGAKPSHVKRTGSAEDVGILRFDFPGYSGEETLGGQKSNFNKIVSAETAAAAEQPRRRKARGATRKKAAAPARGRGGASP